MRAYFKNALKFDVERVRKAAPEIPTSMRSICASQYLMCKVQSQQAVLKVIYRLLGFIIHLLFCICLF